MLASVQLVPETLVFAQIGPDETATRAVQVRNVGAADLLIAEVALDVPDAAGLTVFYRLSDAAAPQRADGVDLRSDPLRVPPGGALFLTVEYAAQGAGARQGEIRLETNVAEDGGIVRIPVSLSEAGPATEVAPTTVDFGRVPAGDVATRSVTITNIGQAPLTFNQVLLNGSQDFTPLIDGRDPRRQPELLLDPDGDGARGLAPGATMVVDLRYAPLIEGPDRAELAVFSDDPSRPEVIVLLLANSAGACIATEPGALEFRGSPIDQTDAWPLTIHSCGAVPLVIEQIFLSDDSDAAFELDIDSLPELPAELPAATVDGPPAGIGMRVAFTPTEARVFNGTLIIQSNAIGEPSKLIDLLGRGVENECPQAVSVQAEYDVVPLDVITLDGSPSIDPDGPDRWPLEYEWLVVSSPDGSTSVPYENFFNNQQPADGGDRDDLVTPTAQLFVDLAGTYVLELRVRDNLGLSSHDCETSATVVINAQPDQAIQAILTWTTPGDPDASDQNGADLDLHLLHPNSDAWFSAPSDCYFENANPDWGQLENPADDPVLDVDDVSGGPESIRLDLPESTDQLGAPYLVGVHARSQIDRETGLDLGPSLATLRIYIDGELAWDFTEDGHPGSREMRAAGHFWDAAAIEWPSRRVTTRNQYFEQRP